MSKTLRVFQINAFTNQMFRGNPAGVVLDADGLSEDQMQDIARELNNSETAFIFSPEDQSYDIRVRFFTPTTEVPTCGHASISVGHLWAKMNEYDKSTYYQKIKIGTLALDVVEKQGYKMVFMTQGTPVIREEITGELRERVLKALGLNHSDVLDSLPVQAVTTGHGKVIVPLKERTVLNSLVRDNAELSALSEIIGENGFFPFVLDDSEPGVQTHARMFAPKIGIEEDPVTGNGNGPLGAYLVHHKALPIDSNQLEFICHQGERMGRSGYAHVIVEVEDGIPTKVQVGGECVEVFETEISIP